MAARSCMSAILVLCAGLSATEPRMFRGGPEHRGVYPAVHAPGLREVVWTYQTGGRVLSSPVVAGGVLYVGSRDGALYALEARTGGLRWKFQTRGPVNASPAVAEGKVIASSLDGLVYAVDAVTGKAAWTFRTGGERRYTAPGIHGIQPPTETMPDPYDVFLSSPAVAGKTVYVGSGDGKVYALDLASGALRWSFQTGDVVHASPAVAGDTVYIGSWDRTFYALDAKTGAQRWAFATGADPEIHNQEGIASSAAVGGGRVFFGCRDGHFYALDAATGALAWKHDNRKGWVIASPALVDGKVCFPTSDGTRFKVLDAATGALRFDVENRAVSFSSPAVAAGVAYYGTHDGWLQAVDLASGAVAGRFQTEGSRRHGATYTDAQGRLNYGAIYPDRTLDGVLAGLDRMFSLGAILSSPVVEDGILYVGSGDGKVYALR